MIDSPSSNNSKTAYVSKEQAFLEETSAKFLQAFMQNHLPFPKSFSSVNPFNASTGKAYAGLNYFTLQLAAMEHNYQDPRWMTYKQAQAHGGYVERGSTGTRILYYEQTPKLDQNNQPVPKLDSYQQPIFSNGQPVYEQWTNLKSTVVFNAEQIKGINFPPIIPSNSAIDKNTRFNQFIANTRAKIITGAPFCTYNKGTDEILLASPDSQHPNKSYQERILYTLYQWTASPNRLNRYPLEDNNLKRFATEKEINNSLKELLAGDLCVRVLANRFGLEEKNPNFYDQISIQKYKINKILKNDPRELIDITAQAFKAQEYLKQFDIVKDIKYAPLPAPTHSRSYRSSMTMQHLNQSCIKDNNANLVSQRADLIQGITQSMSKQRESPKNFPQTTSQNQKRYEHKPRERVRNIPR